jgi:hypothetical protein
MHAKSSRSMFDTGRSSLAAVDRRPVFFPEKRLRLPRFVVESWPESVSAKNSSKFRVYFVFDLFIFSDIISLWANQSLLWVTLRITSSFSEFFRLAM